MTTSPETEKLREVEQYDQLVTPEFCALADFAGFGAYEAVAVQETGRDIAGLLDDIAEAIATHLMTHPESAALMGGSDRSGSQPAIKEWLSRTSAGPFDGELAAFLREISHLPGHAVTFPGVQVPLAPHMILALTAWVQGQVLDALGKTCDIATLSAAGSAWMNQFMLQLAIILEPHLAEPDGPLGNHEAAEFHPYAQFAGLGAKQAQILRKTGPLLEPAAGGVVAVAYDHLLSRPESAGYFQDAPHLAQRKKTLKTWWSKSTTKPMDGDFHAYLSRVADAHVKEGGQYPNVVIPADLTIALMGWVEMRVMTALTPSPPTRTAGTSSGSCPNPPQPHRSGQHGCGC